MSSKLESMTGKVDVPFPEYDAPPGQPIALAQSWFHEAIREQLREPRSMVLTTANSTGLMSSRVMGILGFPDEGISFATHGCSRKIMDARSTQLACGHFYWKELGRQLSVSGKLLDQGRAAAVEEWNRRPVPLHSMSTASRQSEPLVSHAELLATAHALEGGPLPCPERFVIYLLVPQAIEFWSSSSDRLHRRLRFERSNARWECTRLQP
jgi:pyridoxine/pyridoxamine 5'-phosphate oxidase